MACECFISADVYHRAGLAGSRVRVREERLTMLAQTHPNVSMGGELLASAIRYLQSRGLGLGGLPAIETTAKRVEEPPAGEAAK